MILADVSCNSNGAELGIWARRSDDMWSRAAIEWGPSTEKKACRSAVYEIGRRHRDCESNMDDVGTIAKELTKAKRPMWGLNRAVDVDDDDEAIRII